MKRVARTVARARRVTERPTCCSARCTSAPRSSTLLLLEHPHVYTLGSSADVAHVLVDPASVGADMLHVDRGCDVTYHGPRAARPVTRSSRWPSGRAGNADGRRVRAVARGRAHRDTGRLRHRRRSLAAGTPGVWAGDERRSPPLVSAWRAVAPVTASPSTSALISRCSRTSSVRHLRSWCHLDGEGARRRARHGGWSSTARAARTSRRRSGSTRSGATDVVWRESPDDLSRSPEVRWRGPAPVRLLGRLAEAAWPRRRDQAARVDARARPAWTTATST